MNILSTIQGSVSKSPKNTRIPEETFIIPLSNPDTNFSTSPGLLTSTVQITNQIIPVLNGTYIISASSTSDRIAYGFNASGSNKWTSGTAFNYGQASGKANGEYVGSNNLGGISGEWLKVQCPFSFVPTKYTIRTNYSGSNNQVVEKHAFFGSTNGSTWVKLNEVNSTITTTNYEATLTTTNSYNHYALLINKIVHANGGGSTSGECIVGMGVKGVV
jgi:hypothetical protein